MEYVVHFPTTQEIGKCPPIFYGSATSKGTLKSQKSMFFINWTQNVVKYAPFITKILLNYPQKPFSNMVNRKSA